MAVEITPLGFKKPDGRELVRNMDNVISDNAQKAEELIAALQKSQAAQVTADPSYPGLYLLPDGGKITADPANPGLYLIGA